MDPDPWLLLLMGPEHVLLEVALLVELHGTCSHWADIGLFTCVHSEVRVELVDRGHHLVAKVDRGAGLVEERANVALGGCIAAAWLG